jgi:hypothetical protein
MRFLAHELDGRNRLDHVQQRLSGAMSGTQPLRRWIRSRVEGLRRAGRLG